MSGEALVTSCVESPWSGAFVVVTGEVLDESVGVNVSSDRV